MPNISRPLRASHQSVLIAGSPRKSAKRSAMKKLNNAPPTGRLKRVDIANLSHGSTGTCPTEPVRKSRRDNCPSRRSLFFLPPYSATCILVMQPIVSVAPVVKPAQSHRGVPYAAHRVSGRAARQ